MSDPDDIRDLTNVGERRAEQLRDAGFESAADVRAADLEDLTAIERIGESVAEGIQNDEPRQGAATNKKVEKFDEVRDELLKHAAQPKTKKGVARDVGIARETLYKYLDEHEGFASEFRKARGVAERRLIERGLEDDPDVDTQFVKFLLERSYDYTKEERHKIDADVEHSGDIGWRDYIEAAQE
ncbi:hypothetical protein HALG_00008 [Halorubrum virus CGphi46]|uniref:Helix-hairpin-helix domain-containing protein n=1 Tax=Halorubrum virus CGphi46 TaxID=754066 RepID=R9TMJ4_9CAUD|nr:terminase small subunit [Halorubrum virus CGphi46]AGN33796.1 hypothetical protein HALG_00008 [Halorubrum virus CGphi46]